ncbi:MULTISPECIES: uroporphyrinogen-III synthase [unclassified Ruegeria]|uniref:uroporphyrinogen-III synthase n=1 Tax=unclassified Ruegeria TaxID=2625375 RepID=UPI001488672C|nr:MULTISPECIES: uroporphyrinogen-III synthase [unclassified Ruegeria]NOD76020.1 uroporphyrinogen-III synthase [Ruegeria sp. HKCCD4332]NOD89979.1 uroporphyrinogen-III synthase [Ruegeria sp. HKCCD4318]NOE15052.1 uroporphyrinogen-III synthase [Ruegeria sp. HKCCD4318-2]NOG10737.1 uroporphyrinogen-III synthase [Ruegeria sp. HKCCD4315]
MTRPRAASKRFVAQLPTRVRSRVQVIYSPILEIRPLSVAVETEGVKGLIFTSANAVNAAASKGVDRTLPAYCVGPSTTGTAKGYGWQAEMVGAAAEELVGYLLKNRPDSPLLHLRGEHTRGNIAARLTESGLTVREQPVYQQLLLPLTPEAADAADRNLPVIAPLFSPRTARHFADIWSGSAPLWLAAISQATADPLYSMDYAHLKIAKAPTPKKMRKAVKKLVKHVLRVEGGEVPD